MELSHTDKEFLIAEVTRELGAVKDGGGKNLIARCPFCGKPGKFGVYIGLPTVRKKPFMSNCFSCGRSTLTPEQLFEQIGRPDLILTPTAELDAPLDTTLLFPLDVPQEEIDDRLDIVPLPPFYRRCFAHPYLKERGFTGDDFEYFPVGTTRGLNRRWDDYVLFPIIDEGDIVGYVTRHTWSKAEIDTHNRRAKRSGDYKILRYRNSVENDFVKLLYNYDAVIKDETDTVVMVEGIFDVVALVRKLELYDNTRAAVVATFGKKISRTQVFKLQSKGVRTVVVGYDGDAVEAVKKTAAELSEWFEVLVADIPDPTKDWEDLTKEEIYEIFTDRLYTPSEYRLMKVQE